MKGVIFNIFEELVTDGMGPAIWDSMLAKAGLDGAYTSLGSYPDAQILGLVAVAAEMTGQSDSEVLRWFGRNALGRLALRYPGFFTAVQGGRDFILSLNTVIHPEVHKLYAGAACPRFDFVPGPGPGTELRVGYHSARKLCDLAHGFIEGVGDHFGEDLAITHHACMHHGDRSCQIGIRWH